jgi:hypothetical protein
MYTNWKTWKSKAKIQGYVRCIKVMEGSNLKNKTGTIEHMKMGKV